VAHRSGDPDPARVKQFGSLLNHAMHRDGAARTSTNAEYAEEVIESIDRLQFERS
jgi:predicted fused transcriptional regulator/phosphomethylpyrimidine kinase